MFSGFNLHILAAQYIIHARFPNWDLEVVFSLAFKITKKYERDDSIKLQNAFVLNLGNQLKGQNTENTHRLDIRKQVRHKNMYMH